MLLYADTLLSEIDAEYKIALLKYQPKVFDFTGMPQLKMKQPQTTWLRRIRSFFSDERMLDSLNDMNDIFILCIVVVYIIAVDNVHISQ